MSLQSFVQTAKILHQFLITQLTLYNGLKLLKVIRRHFHNLYLKCVVYHYGVPVCRYRGLVMGVKPPQS